MSKGYLLGVDIGTYESKGVITNTDGHVVSTQIRSHKLSVPRQGWAEHDAEDIWWGDFCSIVQGLLSDSGVNPSEILAIGCSAIGPDMLPVNKQGEALRPAILYGIDTRATAEIAELENQLGSEQIFKQCGNALSSQSVGPKILWLKNQEPKIYEQTHKFVTGTTFLVARLTGEYVIDHYTAASFVPLYDISTGTWHKSFCENIVDPERLPRIAWSTEIAGTVTKKAADQTGLAEGTPVIVGTVDAAAEAVSVGVISPGQMMLMYGSTVFMIEVVDKLTTDERLWSAPYLFPGTSCLMAGMATSGALTRWFRDNFSQNLVEIEEATGQNAYSVLARKAMDIAPGSDGLVVLPYFSGERTPINDPKARGVIFGLTLAHSRDHVFRALLEGVGYGIRHHLDVLKSLDAQPQEVVAVGGGTKNPLWLQIASDIGGIQQNVPAVTIGASYGDAFLAGLGAGVFPSYNEISNWVKDIQTVTPHQEATAIYERYLKCYYDLYNQTKGIMHTIHKLV